MIYSFKDDYSEGCLPEILTVLSDGNLEQRRPYGHDRHSERARQLIRRKLNQDQNEIFFVGSGTMANLLMIAATIKPFEAAISVSGGHIAAHETGAIERAGHKVLEIPSHSGKLSPIDLRQCVAAHQEAPHMVRPRLVYISNATETGRVYLKEELSALYQTCQELDLLLMLDGARLGAAMMSEKSDLSWPDLGHLTDMFWIGGTKNGAFGAEAIVFNKSDLAEDFEFHIKQRGAMMSKSRFLGQQFTALFTDDRFDKSAQHARSAARKMAAAIVAAGYELAQPCETNQIFPILPDDLIQDLAKDFAFHNYGRVSETHAMIRLVTSWATPDHVVKAFCERF